MNAPRDDYFTSEGHYQEARRLLWVIDGELQSDAPRTIGELAVIALAHAITALAAVELGEETGHDDDQAAEGDQDDNETYACLTCGALIGVFIGHGDGWLHYRGEGTAASPVELFDAGHEATFALGGAQEIQEGETDAG